MTASELFFSSCSICCFNFLPMFDLWLVFQLCFMQEFLQFWSFLYLHFSVVLTIDDTAVFLQLFPQVEGTPERPRLCVFRSNKHLYVQVIDDTKMHTLASASTMQKPVSEEFDCTSGPTIVSLQI